MTKSITIIYAYRNRDVARVQASLFSLQAQAQQNFNVVFVDYGSEESYAVETQKVVSGFAFAAYFYVAHCGLLWNKSKALNYGISQAKGEFIFIADVDLIFHPGTIDLLTSIADKQTTYLFTLSYLTQKGMATLRIKQDFETIEIKNTGTVNGMVLVAKEALEKVHGLDTFFYFYGSEDVDLFQRLEHSGQKIEHRKELFFKHQWHVIYNSYNDANLCKTPRLFNIKRINQQHYFYHKNNKTIIPQGMDEWGEVIKKEEFTVLNKPTIEAHLPNIQAQIIHFLEVELVALSNVVIKLTVAEDSYYSSFKYLLKKFLKKQTQPYISIKQVNDLILSKIVFQYGDCNYLYAISEDLKSITFILQIK
jgi:glycosyltransferase involved in cell wall biosynthesis